MGQRLVFRCVTLHIGLMQSLHLCSLAPSKSVSSLNPQDGCRVKSRRRGVWEESGILNVAGLQVCEEWFARIRPLLLRLATLVDAQSAVISHSFARITELKAQLRALLAAPKDLNALGTKPQVVLLSFCSPQRSGVSFVGRS